MVAYQKAGYLRLSTVKVAPDFLEALNTLTQKPFIKYDQTIPTTAVTKLDIAHMENGDIAGLCVFQDPYAYIAVKQINGTRSIIMMNNNVTIDSAAVTTPTIYLRTNVSNASRKASFEYSFDNKSFTKLGNELNMRFSLKIFTGNKFCLFNYATKKTGGYVDFDWFRVN